MNYNPFNIPDLTPMYDAVRDYVKENQGKQGFILTADNECGFMYSLIWRDTFDCSNYYDESAVVAVRVNDKDRIQIIFDSSVYDVYDPEIKSKVVNASEEDWFDIEYEERIYYLPTIFNLAENIEQYVER